VYGNAHIDNLFLQGGIRVKDVTSIQVFQVGGVTAYGLQSIQNSIIDVDITAINFLGTIKIGGIAVSGDTQISSTTYSGNIVVDSSDSNIIVAGFVSDADHTITENSVMSGSISVINANQVIAGGFYGFSNRQYAVDYYL